MVVRNYPNPCTAATNIEYTLPQSGMVRLTLHDALGREIATIGSGYQSEGKQSVTFDASTLAQGVYFYRLQTERGMISGQMNVVR